MPVNLKELKLGLIGMTFAKEYLSYGTSLSKALLERLYCERTAKVMAVVPEGITLRRAVQFSVGGMLSAQSDRGTIPNLDLLIGDEISEFLIKETNGAAIMWNYMQRKTDPFVMNSKAEWFSVGNDVYYIVTHENIPTREHTSTAMRAATALPYFLIGLCRLPELQKGYGHSPRDEDYLRRISSKIERLYLLAYDGEAYVKVQFIR